MWSVTISTFVVVRSSCKAVVSSTRSVLVACSVVALGVTVSVITVISFSMISWLFDVVPMLPSTSVTPGIVVVVTVVVVAAVVVLEVSVVVCTSLSDSSGPVVP